MQPEAKSLITVLALYNLVNRADSHTGTEESSASLTCTRVIMNSIIYTRWNKSNVFIK